MTKKIAIVGSGTAGTLTANLLARNFTNEIYNGTVSIELFGENNYHLFQPGNLDVAFKGASPKRYLKDEDSLLETGIAFRTDPVDKIDLPNRKIKLSRGAEFAYDYLVIATGSVASPESMEGLAEGALSFHKDGVTSAQIWQALNDFKGGKIVVAVTAVPHKCPPSPNEAAFLVADFLKKRGIREKTEIKFVTPYPRPYPAQKIGEVVQRLFDEKKIEMMPFFNADYVDPKQKIIYSLEGEKMGYDLLIAVPPHRGAQVILNSGFGDQEGWIPTDKERLTVKGYEDAYAIGDATDIPISKSGVVAHLESLLTAKNISNAISGNNEIAYYNGRINCPMEVGGHNALFVSATYTYPPPSQNPSIVKYFMKRAFGRLYWSALHGSWEWLFKIYFGETSSPQRISLLQPEAKKETAFEPPHS